jgi:hypothetical protein
LTLQKGFAYDYAMSHSILTIRQLAGLLLSSMANIKPQKQILAEGLTNEYESLKTVITTRLSRLIKKEQTNKLFTHRPEVRQEVFFDLYDVPSLVSIKTENESQGSALS